MCECVRGCERVCECVSLHVNCVSLSTVCSHEIVKYNLKHKVILCFNTLLIIATLWSTYIHIRMSLSGPPTYTYVCHSLVHLHTHTYVTLWSTYIHIRMPLSGPPTYTYVCHSLVHLHTHTYVKQMNYVARSVQKVQTFQLCTHTNYKYSYAEIHNVLLHNILIFKLLK